ncbi:MAG TPA: hypothetical protein VMB23_05925 [Spirochaetia bacterium]|nr:hypothetical protein [Spirochaetia bacterium]
MIRALSLLFAVGSCVLLTGCPQAFDGLFNQSNPHSLSASTGEGTGISLSWSAPKTSSGDEIKVSTYNLFRDETIIASPSGTGWTDYGVAPADSHSYRVTANLSAGGTSGSSNSASGWYVPAKPLEWGDGPGVFSTPGTVSVAPGEGWFKTLLVLGWTYHLGSTPGTVEIRDWDSPETVLGSFTGGSFTWNGDKTKKVWVKAGTGTLEAWHD